MAQKKLRALRRNQENGKLLWSVAPALVRRDQEARKPCLPFLYSQKPDSCPLALTGAQSQSRATGRERDLFQDLSVMLTCFTLLLTIHDDQLLLAMKTQAIVVKLINTIRYTVLHHQLHAFAHQFLSLVHSSIPYIYIAFDTALSSPLWFMPVFPCSCILITGSN